MLNNANNPAFITKANEGVPGAGRDLAWLARAHNEQLSLCSELEDIADSLPAAINRQKCIYAAKALGPLIKGIHQFEESVVFPRLLADARSDQMDATVERLKFEHCEDECFAEELTDALLKLGSGAPVNMEAVGYMLRGFFEGLRRHIAFEREFLLRDLTDDPPVGLT
ncbi:hemerythrin domain-containing protein [Peteryoungia ipomoeae]|uniref:Hemerythrin domain-containing protein n=1 Tax=Peteryoungia ipomoeae TaxID=1210932 RepID=A0A4S8PAF5_9HYPH|nr:hemerythrin domain-containing protein [Peteryoungia ipomoeae]THV25044.1 hemerythrin domain-containing protein [Peteryoungia ipomoeae]